jgi:hypothetical protein
LSEVGSAVAIRLWWNGSKGLSIANWDESFAIWIFLRNGVEVESVGDDPLVVVGHWSLGEREKASKLLKGREE